MPVVGLCRVVKLFYKGALRLSVLCKISDRKNIAQKFRLHFLENHDKSIKAKKKKNIKGFRCHSIETQSLRHGPSAVLKKGNLGSISVKEKKFTK